MILFAQQIKEYVYAYNESKEKIFCKKGELYQYTDSTVAIKNSDTNTIYIYGVNGELLAQSPKDFVDMSNIIDTII